MLGVVEAEEGVDEALVKRLCHQLMNKIIKNYKNNENKIDTRFKMRYWLTLGLRPTLSEPIKRSEAPGMFDAGFRGPTWL